MVIRSTPPLICSNYFKILSPTKQDGLLGSPVKDYPHYREWIDGLYFLFRESVGRRLENAWPSSFADVNVLRTAERHDVDHGELSKITRKRRGFGAVFKKYA